MARQPRLVIPGLAHLVSLPALAGTAPFAEASDRDRFLAILRAVAATEAVQVHAYALLPGELRALVTPQSEAALARWVQAFGRRYVSAYNRQHRRAGTLWAGRFRSAAVEPGRWTLLALRHVDGATDDATLTSAGHRLGGPRDGALADPQEYWSLGNTPFDRQSAYARLLGEPLGEGEAARLQRCLGGGWVCADDTFIRRQAQASGTRVAPRPRGRPARG